jgi:DNA helicase HerA-like ATPase
MGKPVIIPANEHVFIPGKTGTGKTFLARKYLAGYENVVAIDTKGMLDWPEIPRRELTIVTRLKDLPEVETKKIIYRPVWQEMTQEIFNEFFKWCYLRRNTIVWIDEAMSITPSPFKIPDYYKAILTRGRERNTSVWSLTQRPSGIAQVIMSEATHFFVFDLNLPQDREKLVEVTGAPELSKKPGKYIFWYFHVEKETAWKAKLVQRKGGTTFDRR